MRSFFEKCVGAFFIPVYVPIAMPIAIHNAVLHLRRYMFDVRVIWPYVEAAHTRDCIFTFVQSDIPKAFAYRLKTLTQ